MAVKGSATITLTSYRDTQSVTRYYKLQTTGSSAPLKPETKPPSSDWTDSEPDCDISKELYFCDLTIFSNGEWEYSTVSKSTSYEAAKQAYNRADNAQKSIDNLEIGGRNLLPDTDFGDASKKYIVPDGVVEGSGGEGGFRFTPTTQIESGIEYTLSLRMRGVANVNFYELNTGGNIAHRIAKKSDLSETDYKKISLTFVVSTDRTFQQVFICTAWGLSATGDWFEIEPKSLKLEKSNKATDWTPAPEDVDAGITNAQTSADTAKANAATAQSTADTAKANAAAAQTAANNAQTTANEALKGSKENATQMAQMVLDFNGDIANLQDQIDGNIATWFYDVDPAMNLPPVTDWDTDKKKDAHLGDIYYNTVKGYAWRFMKSGSTYSWERITDTDVTKALADAAKAQDTADSKRRVFYNTPTVPYDAGDLWVQGSGGDILRCAQAKTSTGSYNRNDWVLASKYTDNSALTTWIEGDFATTIRGLEEGLVDAKVETYYQTTDPSTGWSDTQKSEHKGDLWYNSTASVQKYYRWSGTAWQELTATPPQAVFDNIDKKATIYTGMSTPSSPNSGDLWFKGANEPILTYVNNSWVEYNKYTDDSTAIAAQTGVDSLNDTVFGVQTFEYILDGVTIPAHKREDGTYYYILNDEEVDVAESDLVHDADGELTSYQEGGIYQSLNDMSENIDAIDKKVDGFDVRENAIYESIQNNSLIARKNARVEENSIIITNDTTTEELLNYLQINADSIVIYGNGKDIVTIAKTTDDSGYMKMNGTSMLQAQESKFSTMRMRSADGVGNLALVAGSNGHVSLREVLD